MDVNVMTEVMRWQDMISEARLDHQLFDRIRVGSSEIWAAFVAATDVPLYRDNGAAPGVGTLFGLPVVVDSLLAPCMIMFRNRLIMHRESDDAWLSMDLDLAPRPRIRIMG